MEGPAARRRSSRAIGGARHSVLVQAYAFTSGRIAKAIVEAHRRGVDVRVILDKSNAREGYSAATFLQHMGIPPLIDSLHGIAHNKVMVIDDRLVITGSFNFTTAAESRNAENVAFIDDPAVAAAYAQNWEDHAGYSRPIEGAETQRPPGSDLTEPSLGVIVGNRRSRIVRMAGLPLIPEHFSAQTERFSFTANPRSRRDTARRATVPDFAPPGARAAGDERETTAWREVRLIG